jgi:hypothetical protein
MLIPFGMEWTIPFQQEWNDYNSFQQEWNEPFHSCRNGMDLFIPAGME